MIHDRKSIEESRRERAWDPGTRWKVLQDTMTWAENQNRVNRNTPEFQLAAQAAKHARMTAEN